MKFSRWLGLLFLSGSLVATEFDHSHKLWDTVLKKHVHGTLFDYASLAKDSRILDEYLVELNAVTRPEVDTWSLDKQLAFWINAYNAFTVRVILDNYPISSWTFKGLFVPRNSIIQIPGVWTQTSWAVAGQALTLNHIEHGLIRPTFKEPRIHFAIVCASIGCPNLRAESYAYDKLESQLEDQTRIYFSNTEKGVFLDFDEVRVCVSKLFKWFNEDFDVEPPDGFRARVRNKKERNVLHFLAHYFQDTAAWNLLQSDGVDVDFLSYDWSLNEVHPDHVPAS